MHCRAAAQEGKGIGRLMCRRLGLGWCGLVNLGRARVEAAELSKEVGGHVCKVNFVDWG